MIFDDPTLGSEKILHPPARRSYFFIYSLTRPGSHVGEQYPYPVRSEQKWKIFYTQVIFASPINFVENDGKERNKMVEMNTIPKKNWILN
jgi:hypothetical protein